MKSLIISALAISACVACFGATAQETNKRATLEVRSGSVMTVAANGYQNAHTGQTVYAGDGLMVGDNARAAVVFDNGCALEFTGPNVYVVPATCHVASQAAKPKTPSNAAIIVGAGVLGAAILNSMNDAPAQPLSAGPRDGL